MVATQLMMDELALVASASHNIWGTVDDGEPPPPEPGPVPNMYINFVALGDCNGTFVSFEPEPTNAQADLDSVAIYPGEPTHVFAGDGSACPNEGTPYMLECTWNTTYLRWEFDYVPA